MNKTDEATLQARNIADEINKSDKPRAVINNWWITGNGTDCWLVGKVSKHPKQGDFTQTKLQQTSAIVRVDLENELAETINTVYVLGTPAASYHAAQ
jgi:isochorismate hydrolase